MLASKNRLRNRNTIGYLLNKGQWVKNEHFTLKYTRNRDSKTAGIAILISTKVEKRAVYRNRLKRRIAESFRHLLGEKEPPYQLIIIAKNTALNLNFQEIQESIHSLLKKIPTIHE